ncbi:MAG: crossover junction endodeoxyribonuclease RuvC [Candidatus Doudnabacteria bacterium]|nr:crossover junction endodeoxyribonuclease RuvC [Candidatus Doudnabacteria bacterium]
MIILGIDPGTATTGYGIIQIKKGASPRLIEYGCITTPKRNRPEKRLTEIYKDLKKLIKKHKPGLLAVESLFFFKNLKTAISVAQARGVVLLCASESKIKIAEFAPLEVKMSLTSYGRADKKQVQYMVKKLLGLKNAPKPDDAADALAVAICASSRLSFQA